MIEQSKIDNIFNALLVGMTTNDAFLYAGLNEDELYEATTSPHYVRTFQQYSKQLEFHLLSNVKRIADDKELNANTWLLEHLYPRYSQKGQVDGAEIRLVMSGVDPKEREICEVHQ